MVASVFAAPVLPGQSFHRRQSCRRHLTRAHAGPLKQLKDAIDSLSFEKWAPRSSRAWRLRPVPGEGEVAAALAEQTELEIMSQLQKRIQQAAAVGQAVKDPCSDLPDTSQAEPLLDADFAALNRRIQSLSPDQPLLYTGQLTGRLLQQWITNKYGRAYDLSIVRRDIPGKSLVRLNVMWTHLEQASFPMTECQYIEKLDTIAYYLTAWRQVETVRAFFMQPPKSQRGLPARPVVGSAISVRLDLSSEVIQEWFGQQ